MCKIPKWKDSYHAMLITTHWMVGVIVFDKNLVISIIYGLWSDVIMVFITHQSESGKEWQIKSKTVFKKQYRLVSFTENSLFTGFGSVFFFQIQKRETANWYYMNQVNWSDQDNAVSVCVKKTSIVFTTIS